MVEVLPIDQRNFREAMELEVSEEQSAWVATTAHYLALCAYGGLWHPLGLYADGSMVGFAMWAHDRDEGSHWIGGFLIDRAQQRRGYGRAAIPAIIEYLRETQEATQFGLSYAPDNGVARDLYAKLGFKETGEAEEGELVARLR